MTQPNASPVHAHSPLPTSQPSRRSSFNQLLLAVLTVAASIGAGTAYGARFTATVYDDVKQELRSVYRLEKHQCMRLTGNAKDVCKEEVDGREQVALAQLKYNFSGSSWDALRVGETLLEARFKVAKERCDSFWDVREDACEKQAWDAYDRDLRELRNNRKADEPPRYPDEAKRQSDYTVAATRCQALEAGHDREVCEQALKAQYGMR